MKPMRVGESNDPGVREAAAMFRTPFFVKKLYAWYLRYVRRDEVYAGLVEEWYEKDVPEYLALIARREGYRERWFEFMRANAIDFVLTVPNSLPAPPIGGMKAGWKACGYTFLWNIVSGLEVSQSVDTEADGLQLDYSAGVLPVTHVDSALDALGSFKAKNAIEAQQYRIYDAQQMHGLPVGVQVVGKRLEEEKVLEGMKIIEGLLKQEGKAYVQYETDD